MVTAWAILASMALLPPKEEYVCEPWKSCSMVPWVFLWQQHDLYGVANWIDWTPRADEKVWMYEAKVVPR